MCAILYICLVLIFHIFYVLASLRLPTGCPIYITLSLADEEFEQVGIEVNWGPACNSKPEWIGLFTENPATSNTQPEFIINHINTTEGKRLTKLKLDRVRFPKGLNRFDPNTILLQNYNKGKCLPYYVGSFNGNELLTVECLKLQPNWMASLEHISQIPLKNIFIPGTHASGAYISYNNESKQELGSMRLKDYVIAQHYDIWTQLMFGIRFLDISVGFKNEERDISNPNSFWITNENIFINPLRDVLLDIKRFLDLTKEIVIIDFSSFPIGFYNHPERHSGLVHLLRDTVGGIAYEPSKEKIIHKPCYMLTIDDIRKQNKSLVILYPIEELKNPESESRILCPSWKRFSTGFMNNTQVLEYMSMLFSKKKSSSVDNEGWIFQALRSFEQSFNSNKLETIKKRAMNINSNVTNWLRGPWSLTANVITLDFFSSTQIVDLSIYANLHKTYNLFNQNLIQLEISPS